MTRKLHHTTIIALSSVAALVATGIGRPVAAGPLDDGAAEYDKQHYVTAMQLWRPLADAGNADAQVGLGVMYRDSKGVPHDNEIAAYMWFSLAASQGNKKAEGYRDVVAQRMTAAQIAEAQKRVREWTAKR